MITRKIRIYVEKGSKEPSLIAVKSLCEFTMFEKSFFAHRTYSKKPQTRSNRTYTVTELTSGFAVRASHKALLRDEILESHNLLERMGEEKTKKAIDAKIQELGLAN